MSRTPDYGNGNGGGGTNKPLEPATRLVTAGRDPTEQHGFVNTPIYRGSTVLYPNVEKFLRREAKYTYGTKGTPTIESLEIAWSELCAAAGTVLVPSGLAATAVALMSSLKAGDHLLVPDSAYRPTRNFCDTFLTRYGVETTYYDPLLGAEIATLFKPSDVSRDEVQVVLRTRTSTSPDCSAVKRSFAVSATNLTLLASLKIAAAMARQ